MSKHVGRGSEGIGEDDTWGRRVDMSGAVASCPPRSATHRGAPQTFLYPLLQGRIKICLYFGFMGDINP